MCPKSGTACLMQHQIWKLNYFLWNKSIIFSTIVFSSFFFWPFSNPLSIYAIMLVVFPNTLASYTKKNSKKKYPTLFTSKYCEFITI
jgi:hypothetical protein